MATDTFNASGSWTCPQGVTSALVRAWGPGGDGKAGLANSRSGGGGGGGEFAADTVAVTPGNQYTVTVGTGGSGAASSFSGDDITVTAHAGTNPNSYTGGAGGSGSSNGTHYNGGQGGNGMAGTGNRGGGGGGGSAGSAGSGGTGGQGTTTVGGGGGTAGTGSPGGAAGGDGSDPASSNQQAGVAPGGGGGGGRSTSSVSGPGASGTDGRVTLTYTASAATDVTPAAASGTGTAETAQAASAAVPATIVQSKRVTGSHTVTLDSPTTAHNTLYLAYAGSSAGSGDPQVTGVTLGGAADHWESQATQHQGSQSYSVSAVWQDANCAGGQTGIVVSGTNLVAADALIYVLEVHGMGAEPVLEASSSGPLGAGATTWTSNASGGTASGGGVIIGVTAHGPDRSGDSLAGPGSPWLNCAQFQWSGGAAIAGYQVPSANGTYTYSGTSSTSDSYTALVTCFTADTASRIADASAAGGTGQAADAAVTSGSLPAAGQPEGAGEALDAFFSTAGNTQASALAAEGTGQAGDGTLLVTSLAVTPGAASGAGAAYGAAGYAGSPGQVSAQAASGAGEALPVSGSGFSQPVYLGVAAGDSRAYGGPGGSQVSVAPPGGGQWAFLGTLGHVQNLKYSFVMPGGADKMTCILKLHASLRSGILTPGFQVRIHRGGHVVWDGRLDEPAPGEEGWTLTAAGSGQRGNDFTAQWTGTWPSGQPDQFVNNAITAGLNWVNPGVGQPSWAYFGGEKGPDSGSSTVAAALTQICSRGGGTWYVNSQPGGRYGGPNLKLMQIPATVDRLLMVTSPVARTLGSATNQLVIRYQITDDNSSGSGAGAGQKATYGVTKVTNTAEVAVHGVTEGYVDLSSDGVMSEADAQLIGNSILLLYQRASYAGPFTAAPGQMMTANGVPVDPGCDQAGTVCKLVISDFGYGGEVTPATPVVFPVGGYEWDDWAQVATITPFQAIRGNLPGLISLAASD